MKLLAADLLRKRGITAYRLAADSGGRISQRTAYRITTGEKDALDPGELAALCDLLECEPGALFEYSPKRGRG